MTNLNGQTALVTGASQGIGLATARALADAGANVALTSRRSERVERLADEIGSAKAMGLSANVVDFAEVQAAVDATVRRFGSLDILVNNAGAIDPIDRIVDSDPAAWGRVIDVNVKGVYHGLRAALPVMLKQGHGVVVNLSSGAATSALEGWSHYCASKAAAKRLTECAHKEVGDCGIRIVGISPGTVATDMMASIRESGINPVSQLDWSAHIPPEWVGQAIVFLCGPGGADYAGSDFTLKTAEGRRAAGLPTDGID